jgi:hypothetical protein
MVARQLVPCLGGPPWTNVRVLPSFSARSVIGHKAFHGAEGDSVVLTPLVVELKHLSPHCGVPVVVVSAGHVLTLLPLVGGVVR